MTIATQTAEKTFILGKDAALETTIEYFQQQLKNIGITIEETSWLNPVPNVYSVHIRDKNCPQCFANGKGSSQKAAHASALGEFFERLSTNYFFADYYLGQKIAESDFVHYPSEKWFNLDEDYPQGLLDEFWWDYLDSIEDFNLESLVDLQSGNESRGIVALPYVREDDGETVYLPQSLIANLFVSNGMSAGNTPMEARVQGLSEIFERYVKNKILRQSIALPLIPQEILARYPMIVESLQCLEKAGFPIFAFDASLGGAYPVICVVLFNPNNGTSYASFGSHPKFEVALERTVTELLQGRNLKDLDVFTAPTFDNETVSDDANLETHFIDSSGLLSWDLFKETPDYEFVDWNYKANTTTEEFEQLKSILKRENKRLYVMDYQHLGVNACRMIVPGMSEIYPKEDLIYANNNAGVLWREILLDLPNFHHDAETYQELLDELDEQNIDDATRVREFLGIVADNDGWQTLRIGELKAMLYLALNDLANAQMWVEWTLNMSASSFDPQRQHYYRALQQSLTLFLDSQRNREEYRVAFEKMYGEKIINLVWGILDGKENPFFQLKASDENLENFHAHQQLIKAYQKVHRLKG